MSGRGRGQSSGGRGQSPGGRGQSPGRGRGRGDSPMGRGVGTPGQGGRGPSTPRGRGDRGTPGGGRGGDRGSPGGGFGRGGPRGPGGFGGGPVIFNANIPARVDAKVTSDEDKLVKSFSALEIRQRRPLRPGYGTAGKPITLRANFFAIKVPKALVYDYKVDIAPKTDINRLKARIFQLIEASPQCQPYIGHIAHDRSERLVSARELPQPLEMQIPFLEEGQTTPGPKAKTYTVSIRYTGTLDPSQLTRYMQGAADARDYDPLPLLGALNLVIQQHASRNGVRVGRNRHFFPDIERNRLGQGVEAWKGFFTSVRPTINGLTVNVNVCMTAFYSPGNMADVLMSFRGRSGGLPTLPKGFSKGIKVTMTHRGFKYKKPLRAIGTTTASKTFFDCEELGGRVSVEQYFKRKYNITLRHANDLPVIDIGSANRPNHVPAELCTIEPNVPYLQKLNDNETREMIRVACNPPAVNAEAIVNEGFSRLGLAAQTRPPHMDGFGVTVSSEMTTIPARELAPPNLSYKTGKAQVRDGSWNILEVKFHKGAQVRSWWVLVVRDGQMPFAGPQDPSLQGLVSGFSSKMGRSGMTVPSGLPNLLVTDPLPRVDQDPARANGTNIIRQRIKGEVDRYGKPSFILVLLSNRDNYIYPGIKRLGDVEFGIHTIHMQTNKALGDPRKQDQYFSNVALKANTKLGGHNHLLDPKAMQWLMKAKTMMVGIDVTHPGPGSVEGTPSIAAVVASVDQAFVQFPASLRIQQSKKEMLDELRDMLVERLLVFEARNKSLPDRILIFRDGVSEGQYDTVLDEELSQVFEAFQKMSTAARGKPYRPKLSIIICGKRHHARFYPTDSKDAYKNGNTKPGTVVDRGVTSVFDYDFYLQPHAGLQGTVRPTHYVIIYDENQLSADEIQQGAHNISYLYARATKAVSLIPPAYYADLACERGRCYINDFLTDDKTSVSGRKGDRDAERARVFNEARNRWGEGVHPSLRDSMFYI